MRLPINKKINVSKNKGKRSKKTTFKNGSTMCINWHNYPKTHPYVDSNISHLGEGLMLMDVTLCVDKNCPFKIDDSLFNNTFHFQ